jgi:predicted ribosomally synthesized peptide with SipW-like signal peptide
MPEFTVSRRRVLAGLGTIGVASAGAGLGTTAFFSDEESLEGSLEAGKIDLKLDYRSTYVPGDRRTDFDSIGTIPGSDLDGDGEDDRYVLDETPHVVYTADEAAARDDVEAGDLLTEDDWGVLTNSIGCDDAADEYDLVDGDAGVVVDLEDIKPMDEGEFTVSLHVCDNRAYLWMQTEKTLDGDVGVVEPEAQAGTGAWDPSAPDDGTADGDLDDFTYVQAWYDTNCNNLLDGGEPVDVAIVFDTSGSMNETTPGAGLDDAPEKLESVKDAVVDLATFLTTDSRVTVYSFDDDYQREYDLASPDPAAIESAIAGATAEGGTVYSDVVEAAANYLNTDSAARPDARKIMVFLSDGGPKNEVDDAGTGTNPSPTDGTTDEDRAAALAAVDAVTTGTDPLVDDLYTIAYETAGDSSAAGLLEEMATDDDFAFNAGEAGVELTFREIGRSIRGDVLLYQGSLSGFLALGASGVSLDPGQDEDYVVSQQGSADACVDPGVTCIALDWYLPSFYEQADGQGFSQLVSSRPGVADQDGDGAVTLADELLQLRGYSVDDLRAFDAINVVQTDAVGFALRFAAIQCRHNGANRNPYTSSATVENLTGDGFGKAEILGEPGASGKIIQGNQGNFTAAVGGAAFDSGGAGNREVGTTATPPGDGTAIPFTYTWDPDAGANGTYTLTWDYGSGTQSAVYGDDAVEEPNVNGPGAVVGITVRGGEDDGTATVSGLRLRTDSVDETVGPVASGTGTRYSAFAGVPDLADGFTLSGDLTLEFPASPRYSGEIPGMYLYVGQ